MNYLKRAWASLTRRKGKSLILFLVIFILGNVMAGAIAVQQATDNVEKNIKEKLGATASLTTDYEAINDPDFDSSTFKNATEEQVKAIGASPYVKYYDYSTYFYPGAQKKVTYYTKPSEETVAMGDLGVNLKGTEHGEFVDLKEKKVTLTEGRTFTQDEIDNGDAVLIVSDKLAEANNWHAGDTIVYDINKYGYDDTGTKIQEPYYQTEIPFTVIGIFKPTTFTEKTDKKMSADQKWQQAYREEWVYNTAYTGNKIISKVAKEDFDVSPNVEPGQEYEKPLMPVFVLNSPDDGAAFKQESDVLLKSPWIISLSTDQYDSVAGSVKGMAKLSGYVLMISIGASLLIVTLVVLLFLRDRKHELGIYLSLGESRWKVVAQIVVEVLAIALVAITLSVFTGNFLAKGVSGSLMESGALDKSSNNAEMMGSHDPLVNVLTKEDVTENYQVKLDATYILLFYVLGLGTILLSTVLPLIYILRLNPKKIMM